MIVYFCALLLYMAKTRITLTFDTPILEKIKILAEDKKRSVSSLIVLLVEKALKSANQI